MNYLKKITVVLLTAIPVYFFLYYIDWSDDNLKCENCNLVVISLTNTRKDHLGVYGYERDTTPNIDMFFKDSLIFENAFSPSPWTLPNGASLLTSQYPYSHKLLSRYDGNKISEEYKTLAEIMKEKGYKTVAFTGGGDYNRIYGFNRGFDEYDDFKNFSKISENKEKIAEWLKENKKEKIFLFIQGFDTHCPFNPPPPYDKKYTSNDSLIDSSVCYWNLDENSFNSDQDKGIYQVYKQEKGVENPVLVSIDNNDKQRLIDLYDGAIRRADDALGDIFPLLEDKNTIVVFLSEHGDMIGDNGRFMRTDILGSFSDEVLNIPLLVKMPSLDGRRIGGMVNLVDVMPTLLGFLNIDYDRNSFAGKDLSPLIKDGKEVNDYLFGGLTYKGDKKSLFFQDIREVNMIRNLEYKLMQERIYDLKNRNLIKEDYEFYEIKNNSPEKIDFIEGRNKISEIGTLMEELNKWKSKFVL